MQANRFVSCLAGLTGLLLLAVSGVNAVGVTHLATERSVVGGDKNNCDTSDRKILTCETVMGWPECTQTEVTVEFVDGQVKDLLSEQRWACMDDGCRNLNTVLEDDGEDGCVPVEPLEDP